MALTKEDVREVVTGAVDPLKKSFDTYRQREYQRDVALAKVIKALAKDAKDHATFQELIQARDTLLIAIEEDEDVVQNAS